MESAALVEKRNQLAAAQKRVADVFAEMGSGMELSKVKAIDGDIDRKAEVVKQWTKEMNDLGSQVELLLAKDQADEYGRKLGEPAGDAIIPGGGGGGLKSRKSVGELFTEHQFYKARGHGGMVPSIDLDDVDPKAYVASPEMKAVMSTGAGWAPQAIRSGIAIPAAVRPIQVLDIVPQGDTSQAAVVFMEETTATSGAAEVAEGAAYAQSTFVFTERSSPVKKIGHFLPVTDEQLDDVPQVQGWLNNRMPFFVRQRLDQQILIGNGVGANLTGILNVAGIQTQAKGADATPDAWYKAMVKVRITGRALPSAQIMHPTDWQSIRLLKTAEGVYIWGSPSEAVPARLWGLMVAECDALTQGTGLTGDFQNFCELDFRRGLEVEVGYVNDDFSKGQKSIRAQVRVAFPVYRAAAFCTVTGQ